MPYTAIIKRKNRGFTMVLRYQDPESFTKSMDVNKSIISWAKLFETETGYEVSNWPKSDNGKSNFWG